MDPMNNPKVLRIQCQCCGEPVILGGPFTVGCTGCDPGALDTRSVGDILELLNNMYIEQDTTVHKSTDPVFPGVIVGKKPQ